MRLGRAILTAATLGLAAPALAAPVSAKKPETLVEALTAAGYEVTAGTDDTGDPVLDLVMQGYKARLLVKACKASGHGFEAPSASIALSRVPTSLLP